MNLGTLAERFDTEVRPCHRALPDAQATAEVLAALLGMAQERGAAHGRRRDRAVRRPSPARARTAPRAWPRDVPTGPGVYLFRDAAEHVLYVGKATDLRARVRSYFSGRPAAAAGGGRAGGDRADRDPAAGLRAGGGAGRAGADPAAAAGRQPPRRPSRAGLLPDADRRRSGAPAGGHAAAAAERGFGRARWRRSAQARSAAAALRGMFGRAVVPARRSPKTRSRAAWPGCSAAARALSRGRGSRAPYGGGRPDAGWLEGAAPPDSTSELLSRGWRRWVSSTGSRRQPRSATSWRPWMRLRRALARLRRADRAQRRVCSRPTSTAASCRCSPARAAGWSAAAGCRGRATGGWSCSRWRSALEAALGGAADRRSSRSWRSRRGWWRPPSPVPGIDTRAVVIGSTGGARRPRAR